MVKEYLERIEQAHLDILESIEPVDRTIVLWWGFDGLRVNEDGSFEWISRKKPEPINQSVFYQPMQSLEQATYPQETINALHNLILQCAIATKISYPSCLYSGMMTGYANPRYYQHLEQIQNCCCNSMIQR